MIFHGLGDEILGVVANDGVIPRAGEHVSFDGKKEYITLNVVHNYSSCEVNVYVRPATSNDRTFIKKEGCY